MNTPTYRRSIHNCYLLIVLRCKICCVDTPVVLYFIPKNQNNEKIQNVTKFATLFHKVIKNVYLRV